MSARRFLVSCLGLAALAAGAAAVAQVPDAAPPPNPSVTPRRPMPESRYDFRGEHAGVIYTPQDWRSYGEPTASGQGFITPGGFSVWLPLSFGRGGTLSEPVALGSSYEIVRKPSGAKGGAAAPAPPGADPGHFEVRAREEVIPDQWIEVYHPAVYETDAQGREQLVKKEETVRVQKTRVVTTRVWVSGQLPAPAPKTPAAPSR